MNVYQIALPDSPNVKTFYTSLQYAPERTLWRQMALDLAGGFTALGPRRGSWRGDDGRIYSETMHWYEVACTEQCWSRLTDLALVLFPDQESFYTSLVGQATFIAQAVDSAPKGE